MASAAPSLPPLDSDAIRRALAGIDGIAEVRLVDSDLWVIRRDVDAARDYRISHALGDLVDDFHIATLERVGMVPDGVRIL